MSGHRQEPFLAREISRQDVQQWVAGKFKEPSGWQTVRNAWTLLSGILETAVDGYLPVNPARGVKSRLPDDDKPADSASRDVAVA